MKRFYILSLICLIAGVIFFCLGILSGDVKSGIILIFPFISGSGIYAFLSFIFIFIAIGLFMFGFTTYVESDELQNHKKTTIKGGGVVLIGPIPIIFGSNWKITLIIIIIAIILVLVTFFTFKFY